MHNTANGLMNLYECTFLYFCGLVPDTGSDTFACMRIQMCDAHRRGRASAYGCNAMQGAHTGKVGTKVVTRCDSSR